MNLFKRMKEKRLQKRYQQLLEQGMQAQRNGDMRLYAEISVNADQAYQQLLQWQTKQKHSVA